MGLTIFEPAPMPAHEVERERAVLASGALDARNDPVLGAIVEEARRTFGTSMAAISIVHQDWQYLIATAGLPPGPYSRRTSFCGHALMREEQVLFVADACADPRFAGNPSVAEERLLRFYAGAPLLDDARWPLGTICVFDPTPRATFSEADAASLLALSARVIDRLKARCEAAAGAAQAI